jgi:photosystem II stability/assembly factor-like uncharacterized protein
MLVRRRHMALVIVLLLWGSLVIAQGQKKTAAWESIGPEGGRLTQITQDPVNPDILYITPYSTPCPLYKSTDRGNTWIQQGTVPNYVLFMAIAPSNPSIMYGGYYNLYKSTNGGSSWSIASLPFSIYIGSVVVDPTNADVIHLCGRIWQDSKYLIFYFRSINGGASWTYQQVTTEYSYPYCMAVDPTNSDIIYIGGYLKSGSTYNGELLKSTDGGTNWTSIVSTITGYVRDVEIDPSNTSKVYALTTAGVWRSTNGGTNWVKNSGYVSGYYMALDPNTTSNLFVGAYDRIYKSSDSGVNWSSINSGLYGGQCYDIEVDHGSSNNIFYIANPGFFKSTNSGSNWNASNSGLLIADITSIVLDPTNPKKMFAAFYGNAMYKTSDATAKAAGPTAVTWERMPSFYSCHNLEDIRIDPSNPDRIIAMEGGG